MKNRIKQVRKSLGLTQTEFSSQLDLSQNFIAQIESGSKAPSDRTIRDICRVFNVNESWLRFNEGDMFCPRTRNQEILAFANQVMADEDEAFRKRFVHALSESSPAFWEELEKIVARTLKKD